MAATAAQCARALHHLIEPVHTLVFFSDEVAAGLADLGLDPQGHGYVVTRAAPLGRVEPGPVAASFWDFNPGLVAMALPSAWEQASPAQVLEVRARGLQATWERIGGPDETVQDATAVVADALRGADLGGRPLAFANAAVSVPGGGFAALWQFLAVLREHRHDGQVALLTAMGLDPVSSLVLRAAWEGEGARASLQASRVWDDEAWSAAEAMLRQRGWLDDDGALTAAGIEWRDGLESEVDRLAAGPYAILGEAGASLLFDLLRPIAAAIADAGVLPAAPTLPATFDEALPSD